MEFDDRLELQLCLSRLGYIPGRLDGMVGPKTRRALSAAGVGELTDEDAAESLNDRIVGQVAEIPQLTLQQLRELAPGFSAEWVQPLNHSLILAHITPARLPAYLAQLAHESARFATLVEYGPDSYFERYDGRADLGNTQPGDGLRFKGRGPIQITGRANYSRYGTLIQEDLVTQPERAARPAEGFRLAAMYWLDRNLNALVDAGDFTALTRAINGGTNGMADREAWLEKARALFSEGAGVEAPAPQAAEAPTQKEPQPELIAASEVVAVADLEPIPLAAPPTQLSAAPPAQTSPSESLEDPVPDTSAAIAQPDHPLRDWLAEHFDKENRRDRRARLRAMFIDTREFFMGVHLDVQEQILAEGGDAEEALDDVVAAYIDLVVETMAEHADQQLTWKRIPIPEVRTWLEDKDGAFIRRLFNVARMTIALKVSRSMAARPLGARLLTLRPDPARLVPVPPVVVQHGEGILEGDALEDNPDPPREHSSSTVTRRLHDLKRSDRREGFSATDLPTRSGVIL